MFESKEVKELAKKLETQITESWDKWETDKKESFKNIDFINDIIEWRNKHNPKSIEGELKKPSKYLHFGRQIIDDFKTIKLAKLIDDYEGNASFSRVDFRSELPLWLHWEDNGFLLTNEALYSVFNRDGLYDMQRLSRTEKISSLLNIEFGMSIMNSTIKINGYTRGTWTVSEGKNFLTRLCNNITRRARDNTGRYETTSVGSPPAESNLDKLKKLKELSDLGVITQAEFDKKKEELLSEI
jgi:hypothetical protein